MRLYGLSDLHVNHAANRETLEALPAHPDDWLILGGDLGESVEHLDWVLDTLAPRWAQLLWVPGNHELWTTKDGLAGVAKYEALVARCRARGVLTPEDPFPAWPPDPSIRLCPMFLLYDYSFCPVGMTPGEAVAWAKDDGIQCADEVYLRPEPHASREAWCRARVVATERRLAALSPSERTVLIGHWPLRLDVVRLYRIPRFIPWCGTVLTQDWHLRWRAVAVVSGHLHMRATDWRDGVRFEEISLGYPRHWQAERGAEGYLREILPGPAGPSPIGHAGPVWHR